MSRPRSGTAALELALVAPVYLILLLGTLDLSNAILTGRRMEVAATAIAEMASTGSAQTASLNEITDEQASAATTAAFAFFPTWARKPYPDFSVTLSGVSFAAGANGYTPEVVWSVANPLGLPNLRACGALAVAPNTSPPSYAAIPAGDVGPTTLFVADVKWVFTPMFFGFLFDDIPMMETAVVSPRIGNGTTLLNTGLSGAIERCQAT